MASLQNIFYSGNKPLEYFCNRVLNFGQLFKYIIINDHFTGIHSYNVAKYVLVLGKALGLSQEETEVLRKGALLHDIGKIYITKSILHKQEDLSGTEWQEIRQHPVFGEKILKSLKNNNLYSSIIPFVLSHHEAYDGSGYPLGLKGNEIPAGAQVIAIADSFDAMTSERPYRKALTRSQAVNEIIRCSGTQFDPEIAELFIKQISLKVL